MANKKIYINQLSTVLSTTANQSALIAWALNKGIDTFLYYGLKSWLGGNKTNCYALTNNTNAVTLGNFLERARSAGIKSHVAIAGAYGELYRPYCEWEMEDYNGYYGFNPTGKGGAKLINNFHAYMASQFPGNFQQKCFLKQGYPIATAGPPDISGINLECEFWLDHTSSSYNGNNGTTLGVTAGGYYQGWIPTLSTDSEKMVNFKLWSGIIQNHQLWARTQGAQNEAYIGWLKPTGYEAGEAQSIVTYLSSLNLHAYNAPTSNAQTLASYGTQLFNYTRSRLQFLGQAQQLVNPSRQFRVNIIYSMEPGFTGNWMIANPTVTFDQLHNAYMAAYNASTFTGKSSLLIDGYTLFEQALSRTVRP